MHGSETLSIEWPTMKKSDQSGTVEICYLDHLEPGISYTYLRSGLPFILKCYFIIPTDLGMVVTSIADP